jgi:hypothetical protein
MVLSVFQQAPALAFHASPLLHTQSMINAKQLKSPHIFFARNHKTLTHFSVSFATIGTY